MDLPKIEETRPQSTPNRSPPHISGLPNELLHIISEACPFNTAISFRQTCWTLFSASPDPLARMRVPPRYYAWSFGLERLLMDDEYKIRRWGRAVCSVCEICHSSTDFTMRQLECEPTERVCEGAQRLLSIAPNIRLSYQELLRKTRGAYDDRSLNQVYQFFNPPHLYVACRLVPYIVPGPGVDFGGLTIVSN